jgi:hypothetical protein
MKLEQFVQKFRHMLANPNVLAVEGNTIYVFTSDCEFLAFHTGSGVGVIEGQADAKTKEKIEGVYLGSAVSIEV